jgi:hypothetical protein
MPRIAEPLLAPRMIAVCLLSLSLAGCCHYPRPGTPRPIGTAPPGPSVTIAAYGDTRTGPFGLGDNEKQGIHGKVVDDIFAHDGLIDAAIFTGDAVMSNFPLWKKTYWRCFLSQSNRFRKAGIPFYPSLGNHEVLPAIVPLMKPLPPPAAIAAMAQQGTSADLAHRLAKAYDSGEEPTPSLGQLEAAPVAGPPMDLYSKQGQATLKQWEKGIGKGNVADAHSFGQFEHHLQLSFYTNADKTKSNEDTRCSSDAKTFSDDYLVQAKYEYLRPLLQGRSYYSQLVERAGVRVKLIALDTNCLDSRKQQEFFVTEIKNFEGPIIVFGHHPPVNYDADGWPWDKVQGWGEHDNDPLKSYLTNAEGSKVVLWVFGHVHDYQRRGPAGGNQQAVAPVLLVAGGGGAALDPGPAGFQWQPPAWPTPLDKSEYSQVKIVVTDTKILVEARGTPDMATPFQVIDSFTIPLAPTPK